jgi:hypothetical protein
MDKDDQEPAFQTANATATAKRILLPSSQILFSNPMGVNQRGVSGGPYIINN